MSERTWLRHKETGGYFHCPTEAVKEWQGLGWEAADPPEEPDPVVAERIAWETKQRAAQQQPDESAESGQKSEE